MKVVWRIGVMLLCFTGGMISVAAGQGIEPPKSTDTSVKISLFAAEPQIVTPIGATVDSHDRLLVNESNTHFRPTNYQGPPTDRIRILEDTQGDGKADRISTFYEGTKLMMNLAADRDGSIVVSSRYEIFRLVGANPDGTAAKRVTLAKLTTKGDYPHNGLHGLTIAPDGSIYFAIGENFGQPWVAEGTDGSKVSEYRGAGTIMRMDADGRNLTRFARGFWNPFGLGFDPAGQLWAVDNDPDGRPPSRLIQVVPGGDYGFEWRYGRTGLHPLQGWDGELPGTLGMVAGVGEAPCNVRWFRGGLIVSSWRDHQVQSFTLVPHGASYIASVKPLLFGGEDFRPVGLAVDKDGSLFVTDWGSA
ncbi:MAG TPA: PVC-type heme-binding CxxCH protein, partial [Tepidisphaeraceae bacterium]|nr:PVC-type heme-binding CxxCH protein [Tepidisphaeraceae bacterium]